ncbi:cohesin domain-containing protein [Natrarchaeobius chitinivorans]|uniref:Cohesin domain-containing protein n=1 Tax=Natrarchaeobius chitinivorans TaxID=1679083 RepID=A0A3N6M5W9_NATCH|nr:cohesin domain-containing protein [Natrarchaeobius chitinivorans]RQG95954.1 cohesin domain-containing protein [Natrarchaeobius chitinivorans]
MTRDGGAIHSRSTAGVALAVGIVCCLAVTVLLSAPALAGDNTTIFYFEPDETDADPGETITLDLLVSSHGDYNANGIDDISFELAYDADVLTVTEVEHREMLAAGDPDAEVVGTAEIDDDAGTVTVEQERAPSGDGATATEPAATLTVEIADDASATTETIEIVDASAILVTDYPQAIIDRDATVHVDGGAEPSSDGDERNGDDETEGVTFADDGADDHAANDDSSDDVSDGVADESDVATTEESGDSDDDDAGGGGAVSEDPISGFIGLAAILAIAAALLLSRAGN